jgi:hypothetical protein
VAQLDRILVDDRAVIARIRNVGFVGWRDAPTIEHMVAWHRLARTLHKEHGASACIDVVVRGTPRFTEDVRRSAEELARDPKAFELGMVHALLMPGMAGTAVRMFIQTVLLVGRAPNPVKVASDIPSALGWLGPRVAAHGWTERELREGCDELIAALGPT